MDGTAVVGDFTDAAKVVRDPPELLGRHEQQFASQSGKNRK